jgi:large subunit ribosomal protein L28
MAQACEVCGRKPATGNQVTIRGKAKYLGGVGTKITGISRRTFSPNLQRVHITTANGTNCTARVCTRCLRSGAVKKRVRAVPFRLPKSAGGATAASAKGAKPTKTANANQPAKTS